MAKRIIVIFTLLLIGTGILLIPVQSGILLTDGEGDAFYFLPWDSEEITIGWTHSVELTPWKETYRITNNGELSFESTLYKSYGAGTPDIDGKVEFLPNGFIEVTDIKRVIPYYPLFYIPMSNYYIEKNEETYPIAHYVPDNTPVQIHYEQIQLYEWLWLRIFKKEV